MKNKKTSYLVLSVLFLLYNAVAFIIPSLKTTSFWVLYAFTMIAFILQIPIWEKSFHAKTELRSKFLGLSTVYLGGVHLIIQLLIFAIHIFAPQVPLWIYSLCSTLILGFAIVCCVSTQLATNEIDRIDAKIETKRAFLKELQIELTSLADDECDDKRKDSILNLVEKIRFSDPMSNDSVYEIENEIANKVFQLQTDAEKEVLIDDICKLVDKRNRICKANKYAIEGRR